MGKRSDFERVPRDFYPTPMAAVVPLLAHLGPHTRFAEPCAGDGALIDHLSGKGHVCAWAADVEPRREDIELGDASQCGLYGADCFITNPPWARSMLHPIIERLSDQAPTWLLIDADWVHTKQAVPFLSRLRRIVAIGRVKWIPESKMTGKDNCAWHLFDKPDPASPTMFFGRSLTK